MKLVGMAALREVCQAMGTCADRLDCGPSSAMKRSSN